MIDSKTTRIWSNYILEASVEVGNAARRNRGSYSGEKIHLLWVERLVGLVDETAEQPAGTFGRRLQIERQTNPNATIIFSVSPFCGCTRGQNSGKIREHLTEADVTCTKCKKIAERRAARRAEEQQ